MRKVKCPICKRERKVKSDVVLAICSVCQTIMVDKEGIKDGKTK